MQCDSFSCGNDNILMCTDDYASLYTTKNTESFDIKSMDENNLLMANKIKYNKLYTELCYNKDSNYYTLSEGKDIKLFYVKEEKIALLHNTLPEYFSSLNSYDSERLVFAESTYISLFDIENSTKIKIRNPVDIIINEIAVHDNKIISRFNIDNKEGMAYVDPRCKKINILNINNTSDCTLALPKNQMKLYNLLYSKYDERSEVSYIMLYDNRNNKNIEILNSWNGAFPFLTTSENIIAYVTLSHDQENKLINHEINVINDKKNFGKPYTVYEEQTCIRNRKNLYQNNN